MDYHLKSLVCELQCEKAHFKINQANQDVMVSRLIFVIKYYTEVIDTFAALSLHTPFRT